MDPREKLSGVFNKHAGKVVEGRGFEALLKKVLRARLTPEELKEFLASSRLDSKSLFADKERAGALMRKLGDGSLGVYSDGRGIYFSSHVIEFSLDVQNVSPAIMGKVVDAFDEIFTQAPDCSASVKNGTLRPMRRKP